VKKTRVLEAKTNSFSFAFFFATTCSGIRESHSSRPRNRSECLPAAMGNQQLAAKATKSLYRDRQTELTQTQNLDLRSEVQNAVCGSLLLGSGQAARDSACSTPCDIVLCWFAAIGIMEYAVSDGQD
jgi:hypothetical protein